ncbi:hypothetical protein MMC24_003058 [Lignoscripta atroalba]|nr:hypothetical protein [Lignoscripta atroalba]
MPLLFERGSFRRKPLRALFLSALIIVVLFKLISSHRPVIAAPEGIAVVDHSKTKAEERGNAIVVASLKGDDVKWLKDVRPEWEKNIYIADDEERRGELRIPRNKGRESMVYLSFIIDNYNRLPNITIFIHSQRYQWHNDDPLYGTTFFAYLQLAAVLALHRT